MKDMTKGNPVREVLLFSIPMILASVFQQMYNAVDSIIVGQFVGANALAAVGAAGPAMFLAMSIIIGIAMGAMGSDAAIEAADVVLMDDDPLQIAKAIGISRKCIGIVRQNIVFSLVVKFACLALTALGYANMWAAIFADVGVMIIAVLNAIRALKYKS